MLLRSVLVTFMVYNIFIDMYNSSTIFNKIESLIYGQGPGPAFSTLVVLWVLI